jgi:pyrimidine-nucleoside phosphorylase
MAKKLAVGIKHAGLDIRVAPHGNFGKTWDAATQNARLFIEVGRLLEIQAKPVLTDGRYPYQPYIGRKESLLALFVIFRGESSPWLNEHYSLCQTLAISCMPTSQRPQLQSATIFDLHNVFCENVVAQGGDIGALRAMLEEVESAHCNKVTATRDGFACFDLQLLRRLIVDCQNSCINTNRPFPDPVGIILRKRPGEWVRAGDTLATIRVEDVLKDMVLSAMKDQLISVRSLPLSKDAAGIDHE